jgi:hypothetical protein
MNQEAQLMSQFFVVGNPIAAAMTGSFGFTLT